ncbi:4-(cytidine 5'-diphospho)-2-C-methyl-D-erythritol kinase [Salinimonas sediminis]|nr:4-(cytidine 5'-diphospho)-2-C-methyl-D-erythritol kinase [Salinimonas sediminis]
MPADSTPTWWPSPAKLNLFLHVTGRYDNGYHHLQSVFQMLDQGDRLAFEVTDDSSITLATPLPGVPAQDNLVIKAARLLQRFTQCPQGCVITLDKQLPMGGGIGGGSSNAATTLVVLNYLWGCGLNDDALALLGLQLGADVPVFIYGNTAFAEGVGEQLTPITVAPACYLVVNPGVHVSTPAVFSEPELPRNTPKIGLSDYVFEKTHNDCQQIVCNRHPEVAKLLQWLVHYAPSRMTGTGACVFATFSNEDAARKVQAKLPANWSSFVAKGVAQSPLKRQLHDVYAAPDRH